MSVFGFKGLFGSDLSSGDFVVGKEGKTSIDYSEFGIITPYQTLFKKSYFYYNHRNESFDDYKNIGYLDMVESNVYNSAICYKYENMDEYESYIYNKYLKYYELRMKCVEYYQKNKSYLPIGSIISERLSFKPYLFLGICKSIYKCYQYRPSNKSNQININNYLSCNHSNERFFCYLNLYSFFKLGLNIESLISGKETLSSFLLRNNISLLTVRSSIEYLKTAKSNCYYIGKTDINDLYVNNYYDLSGLDFYKHLNAFILSNNHSDNYFNYHDVNLNQVEIKQLSNILNFDNQNSIVLLDSVSLGDYRMVFLENVFDNSNKIKDL